MKALRAMVGMSYARAVLRRWLGSTPAPNVSDAGTNLDAVKAIPVASRYEDLVAEMHLDLLAPAFPLA
jgi:hypothetical protein